MADDLRTRKHLRTRVQARRADIDEFLARARPRRNIMINVSIVFSALAAVLTATPAAAGPGGMTAIADSLSLGGPASVWRPLCIAAFVVALIAAVAANLQRSHDLPAQVAAAETCRAGLESLLATLDFDDVPVHDLVEQYQQYVKQIAFVPERQPGPVPDRARTRA
jgi:hypothetical protein